MKKAVIGIVPLVDAEKESYWMLPGYMNGIQCAGGIPVMLPLTNDRLILRQLTHICDGLLFTGGHDVSPSVYHAKRTENCGESCEQRDEMETLLFEFALELDKPILGICRGIQFINAVLGGTLYQDLPTEHPSDIMHHQDPPYDKPVHQVALVEGSPLHQLLQADQIDVNSYHHQAIHTLAPKLSPMAYSDDGLIEAVCLPDARFVWAVQWHPEFSYVVDANSRKIFEQFVQTSADAKGTVVG